MRKEKFIEKNSELTLKDHPAIQPINGSCSGSGLGAPQAESRAEQTFQELMPRRVKPGVPSRIDMASLGQTHSLSREFWMLGHTTPRPVGRNFI